jgi:hypothetical protein
VEVLLAIVAVVAEMEDLVVAQGADLVRISTDDQFQFGIHTFLAGLQAQAD